MAAEIFTLGEAVRIENGVCTCTDPVIQDQLQQALDMDLDNVTFGDMPNFDWSCANLLLDRYGGRLVRSDPSPPFDPNVLY